MKIAAFCIKHKVSTILAFIMIAVFGVVFYTNLKLALMPNMEFPAAYVMCTYAGAGPEDVEELLTRPLESCIATVSGVDEISSTSSENYCMVSITYADGTDVDNAAIKLREKFDTLSLPDGCGDPVIYNINVNDLMPVAVIALSGEDLSRLQNLADDTVSPALERTEGVASTSIAGGITRQITVETNATALAGYGLSISTISNYLAAANVLYPGGDIYNGSTKLTVTTDGKYQSVEDVANTMIFLPTGGSIRLSEVADVYLEDSLDDSVAKSNGNNCVVLTVSKQSGANEVETCNRILDSLEEIQKENPSIQYTVLYQASDYIMQTANNAIQNIVLGVILSAVVVFIFLRRPGPTVTISLSMPFCVLTVFLLMNCCGISLNMMSLGSIGLCIGMVVDNSIVVLENIYRYAGDGYDRYQSCTRGAGEVFNAITASSLTTIAVFLPIGLSGGITGMMFKDFSLTVTFLILSSLVIAMTLVPLMCYFLLDEDSVRLQHLTNAGQTSKAKRIVECLSNRYMGILNFFLRKRYVAVLVSIGLIVVFLASCLSTDMVLTPETDEGMVSISIDLPTGSELEQTSAYADRVAEIVQENCPELDSIYYTVGSNMMGTGSVESASVTALLVDKSERDRSASEVADSLQDCFNDMAGCEISVDASSSMSMMSSGSDIDIKITGEDYDTLGQIADELVPQLEELPGTENVESSLSENIPAVKVSVQPQVAAQYNLTAATIGAAVRADLTGATATTVTIDNKDLDVVIKGNGVNAESLDALRSMPIPNPAGGTVPLSSIASVNIELSPQSISRENQNRQVEVTGDSDGTLTSSKMNKQVQAVLDAYALPDGYTAEISSAYSDMMDNFQTLILAMIVAIGLVYFILAAQFESFIMPVIVMMILPLSLSGALFGLPLTGMDLSMVVILALIMLVGTVVNSSIVLVDYIDVRRAAGLEKNEAILTACPLRVRPILMTTLTTILALIPMSAGSGEGNEMLQPMGVTMIFGMIISTIVTLLFTPVYYSLLDSLTEKIRGPIIRKQNAKKKKMMALIASMEGTDSEDI